MKDRQCTYNIIMRPVRATVVILQNQSIAYTECVFVALGIQYSMRLGRTVIWVLPGNTRFFHVVF